MFRALKAYHIRVSVAPALSDSASMRSRACAFRLFRHCLFDKDSVERLLEHPLEWYIVKYVMISLVWA